MEEEIIDVNPAIITYKFEENALVMETTHKDPTVQKKVYIVSDAQAKISKINNVIALWEAKKVPYQDIIDKYNELKPKEM